MEKRSLSSETEKYVELISIDENTLSMNYRNSKEENLKK